MGFVIDGTPIPAVKIDGNFVNSADMNALRGAVLDLRTSVLANTTSVSNILTADQTFTGVKRFNANVSVGHSSAPLYLLDLGTAMGDTKIALYGHATNPAGLGVQADDFRFHGTGTSKFSWRASAASASLMELSSAGVLNIASATGLTLNGVAVATISSTSTLTNKTLTSPTINGGALSGTFTGAPTFSGGVTLTAPIISGSTSVSPPVISFGFESIANDTTARFAVPGGPGSAAVTQEPCITFPFACKVSKMYVNLFNSGRNATTFTARKEYADTSLSCSLSANTASNTSTTVSFAAGERLSVKVQQTSTAGTPPDYVTISFMVTQA